MYLCDVLFAAVLAFPLKDQKSASLHDRQAGNVKSLITAGTTTFMKVSAQQ
jgi:hypothetical protein